MAHSKFSTFWSERRLLQACVAIGGLAPVTAGGAGVLLGPAMVEGGVCSVSADSHFRYLSGLLLAIGLAFWSAIPGIERKTVRFRILTFIVLIGGFGRLFGIIVSGVPSAPMVAALAMELAVTPLLCLWQARIGRT